MKSLLILFFTFICTSAVAGNLTKVNALGGKVSILAPKGFGPMSQELINFKYPSSQRPTEVLSDSTGEVSLAFNYTANPIHPSQIKEAHASFSNMFRNIYPTAKWVRDEVSQQNGTSFIVMEFVAPALDMDIHNIIYATSVDGRLLLAAFNTTVRKADEWLPAGKEIMASIVVR